MILHQSDMEIVLSGTCERCGECEEHSGKRRVCTKRNETFRVDVDKLNVETWG